MPRGRRGLAAARTLFGKANELSFLKARPCARSWSWRPSPSRKFGARWCFRRAVEADPGHLVKVLPPLAGRIMQVKVQLGERVDIGQALIVLDSPDLGSRLRRLRSGQGDPFACRQDPRSHNVTLRRLEGAAIKDQQQAETDYVTAEVEFQRAEARLKADRRRGRRRPNKSRTVTITAPISGSVIDLAVAPGAYWNDTTTALMTIADLTTVWVTANVPEKDTAHIAKGQAVDVVLSGLSERGVQGAGALRQRRSRSRHPSHQGTHRLSESRASD